MSLVGKLRRCLLAGSIATAGLSGTAQAAEPGGLTITQDVSPSIAREGELLTFTITVSNTGDAALTDVTVADEVVPGCARTLGTLVPTDAQSYVCTMTAPATSVTHVANVTGKLLVGPPVSSQHEARVDVIHPAMTITTDAAPKSVRSGDRINYTVKIKNTGDVPLTDVVVTDDRTAACGFTMARLDIGVEQIETCTVTAEKDVANTVTVIAKDPAGQPVTAKDEAAVDVIWPGISVTTTGPAKRVLPGDHATFNALVTNSGDVPLTKVTLDAKAAPQCAVQLGMMRPGEQKTVTCKAMLADRDIENVLVATGTDPNGRTVIDQDKAKALYAKPGINVIMKAASAVVAPGGTVTFSVRVENVGNVDLVQVKLDDPALPHCGRAFDRVAAATVRFWTCTTKAPMSGTLRNTATGTGSPDADTVGKPLTDNDTATVSVTSTVPSGNGVAPPKPPLAFTGPHVADGSSGLGFGLVALGAALIFVAARRRRV